MEDWPYIRCEFCRQLYDRHEPEEIIHHLRSGHKPMPGIPDDGLETIPLDFNAGFHSRSWACPKPEPWTPPKPPPPYKSMRPKRRKKPRGP